MMAIALLLSIIPIVASAASTSPSNPNNGRRENGSDNSAGGAAPASGGGAVGATGADRHPDSTTSSLESAKLGDIVTLKGKLKCDLGSTNSGEACSLLFLDATSGRTFQLTAQEKAMRTYFEASNGSHDVTLQGKVMGVETLEVVDVSQR